MTKALDLIADERNNQRIMGFSETHDKQWARGELAIAAVSYILYAVAYCVGFQILVEEFRRFADHIWPFEKYRWNPGTQKRNLIKAGALIVAELDRILLNEKHDA